MRRPIVLVLALLAAAAPVSPAAHAGPSAAARKAAAYARWQAGYARLARHLPLDDALKNSKEVVILGGDTARLMRAGDLDGDGANDLVDMRTHATYDATTDSITETVRLEAHRGVDGRFLWTAAIGTSTYVFPAVAKVGANGTNGLVVAQYDDRFADGMAAHGAVSQVIVTALDGKGKQAWSRTFAGAYGDSEVSGTYIEPYVGGLLNAVAGGGTDVLVVAPTSTGAGAPTGVSASAPASSAQLVLVDGATGVPRPLGAPLPGNGYQVDATAVPDLNGDKLDDVVATTVTANITRAVASSGATGAPLWAAELPDAEVSFATAVGDVTGDGVADVAIEHGAAGALPVVGKYNGPRVSLVDGKTGAVKWTKAGGQAYALAKGSVAVVGTIDDGKTVGVVATAYDASGHARWAARRTAAAPSGPGFADVEIAPIGDVQADGVVDIGYVVAVYPGNGAYHYDGGTFDGRTGRVIHDPQPNYYAPSVSFDGHGDDAYSRYSSGWLLEVTAWRADVPRKLWRTGVQANGEVTRSFGYSLGHDRCAEIVVTTGAGSITSSYVFSGADGRPLWSLGRSGDGAAAVGHPTTYYRKRYVKTC